MPNNTQMQSTEYYTVPMVDGEVTLSRRVDCPWWERISRIYAMVILAVFPLTIGPDTYTNITATKFWIFVMLTMLYLIACLVVGIIFPPGVPRFLYLRTRPLQRLTIPQIFLMAYMVWAIICTIASPYEGLWFGQNRFEGLFSLLLYGSVFLLLSFWGEYSNRYVYGLAIMGALIALIALPQTFNSTILYPEGYNYWNSSFLSTIGNIDCVAGIVCILVPTLLCAFVVLDGAWRYLCLPGLFLLPYIGAFSNNDTVKLGYLAAAVLLPFLIQTRERLSKSLTGVGVILAGFALNSAFPGWGERHFSLGTKAVMMALLAVVLCALGWWLGCREGNWKLKPDTVLRVGYVLIVALALMALLFLFNYSGENRLLVEASEFLHGNLSDTAGSGRGYIWKHTCELIAQTPVMGSGPGSFLTRFVPYNEGFGLTVDFAHNDFLNIGVCTGLVGLALYVAFLLALLVRCFHEVKRCPMLLIFSAGILGYLIYSFFVFSIAIVSPLFWVMAGLADKCVRQLSIGNAND